MHKIEKIYGQVLFILEKTFTKLRMCGILQLFL